LPGFEEQSVVFRDTPPMRLRGAYLTMHRHFQRLFRVHGATADQFVLLTLLAEEDAITQKELVRRSFSDANTITAMLRRLERRGLIRRAPHEHDGRASRVHLTDSGRSLQRQLNEAARELHLLIEETLPEEGRAAILNWLAILTGFMMQPRRPRAEHSAEAAEKL
jgi:DNA-binding MarR family transcriptional regulator